jgi:hypothetical protein
MAPLNRADHGVDVIGDASVFYTKARGIRVDDRVRSRDSPLPPY